MCWSILKIYIKNTHEQVELNIMLLMNYKMPRSIATRGILIICFNEITVGFPKVRTLR